MSLTKCYVCKGFTYKRKSLYCCTNCNYVWDSTPTIKSVYNKGYARHYIAYEIEKDSKASLINDFRSKLIHQVTPKGSTILDYGCGTGILHNYLKDYDYTGFDINKQLKPFWVSKHRPCKNTLDTKKYQCVCFFDSLEHLKDPIKVINNFNPKCCVISIPIVIGSISNVDTIINAVRNSKHFKPGEHIHYFSLKSLNKMFIRCGGKITHFSRNESQLGRENIVSLIYKW